MADFQIQIRQTEATRVETPLLVLQKFYRDDAPTGVAGEVDRLLGGKIARVIERGDFQGRKEENLLLYPASGELPAERVLLLGAGKREDYTVETLREMVGAAIRKAQEMGVSRLSMDLDFRSYLSEHMGPFHASRAVAAAAELASWEFRELKADSEEAARRATLRSFDLIAASPEEESSFAAGLRNGRIAARAENFARDLATRPGNIATPSYLARAAQEFAAELDIRCEVLDRPAIEKEGMGALLAVARGSDEEPRFIVLSYDGGEEGAAPYVLVGKGVTFDSGGISIKPSKDMGNMKYDMSGAAAVLGAIRGIAELELPANVVALVPCTENLPSGRALKPGDVIRSHAGTTIEVVNTDAEGRLILADALSYARRFEPAAMIDAATLTGACVTALGHHAMGLMGNDGDLLSEVRAAGHRVGERCWLLPLWDEYRRQLDSDIADISNSGGRPAGAITAGWFLKEFVRDVPWAHLDIAGMAYRDEAPAYLRKGATGMPTRLLIEWVRARVED